MSISTYTEELTSGAVGSVTADITNVNGILRSIVIIPDSTAAPSANYDIAVSLDGVSIYSNTALSATNPLLTIPSFGGTTSNFLYPISGQLRVVGTNMGASKKTKIIIRTED